MKSKLIVLASTVLLFTSFLTVYAQSDNASDRAKQVRQNLQIAAEDGESSGSGEATAKPRGKARLEANKLRICQNKEKIIDRRMTSLMKMATNMLGKFTAIAERVEAYYLSSGKTVPNYQELVDAINAKKEAVEEALASAQAHIDVFDCTAEDPVNQLTQFRMDMQSVKSALHEYRKAIRDLIVAVRGVVKDTATGSPSASSTASPTGSPSASASPTLAPTPSETPTETPTLAPTSTP